MKPTSLPAFFTWMLLGLMVSLNVQASLLISPMRVVFDDRERAATVTIINTGKTTATYRVELVDNLQTPDGKYQRLADDQTMPAELLSAKAMLRYSPRQVTLKPNERQQVRLSLRKPAGLLEGEYRSHLAFTQLPDPAMLETHPKGAKMQVFMLTGFTIPVQVRHGQLAVTARLANAQVITEPNHTGLRVTLNREGDFSSFGKLQVFWRKDAQSSETLLNFIDNAALYRELPTRTFSIPLKPEQLQPGLFRIVYLGDKHFGGQVFDTLELPYPN